MTQQVVDKHSPSQEVITAPSQQPSSALLTTVASTAAQCQLIPAYLFISWQGVLTLAYKGLPQALEECKCALQDTYASLPAENPGAKWPKTTLGCLRDTARLTSVQFGQLKQLCEEVQRQLIAVDAVVVDSVDLVVYECRSLERVLGSQQVGLRSPSNGQPSAPTAEAVAVVERVVREWEAEDYWFHASKDGNREGHYRGPHVGVTLATWIARDGPQRSANALLLGVLRSFKRQVDTLLPNMYTWFDESALHVTLRNVKD